MPTPCPPHHTHIPPDEAHKGEASDDTYYNRAALQLEERPAVHQVLVVVTAAHDVAHHCRHEELVRHNRVPAPRAEPRAVLSVSGTRRLVATRCVRSRGVATAHASLK
eukprot:scaffold3555_cov58-Phaeocystis_antarctica.AAC.4